MTILGKEIFVKDAIACAAITIIICIIARTVDVEFAKFATMIAGVGTTLMWLFSPKHDVVKGIIGLPIFAWPVIVFVLIICFQFDIPLLIKLIFMLCILILQIGVAIFSRHLFKCRKR